MVCSNAIGTGWECVCEFCISICDPKRTKPNRIEFKSGKSKVQDYVLKDLTTTLTMPKQETANELTQKPITFE